MYSNSNWGHDPFPSHCHLPGSLQPSLGILDVALFFSIFLGKGTLGLKPASFLWVSCATWLQCNLTFHTMFHPCVLLTIFLDFFFISDHTPAWLISGLHPTLACWRHSHDSLPLHMDSTMPSSGVYCYDPSYASLLTRCTFLQVCSNIILLISTSLRDKGIY